MCKLYTQAIVLTNLFFQNAIERLDNTSTNNRKVDRIVPEKPKSLGISIWYSNVLRDRNIHLSVLGYFLIVFSCIFIHFFMIIMNALTLLRNINHKTFSTYCHLKSKDCPKLILIFLRSYFKELFIRLLNTKIFKSFTMMNSSMHLVLNSAKELFINIKITASEQWFSKRD